MKKLTLYLLTVFLSLAFFSMQAKAGTNATALSTVATNTIKSAEASVLLARLDEIKAMDKSVMNFTEKRQLRKEVRLIKAQLSNLGGGVYLSVGAVVSFLLLTLLLL